MEVMARVDISLVIQSWANVRKVHSDAHALLVFSFRRTRVVAIEQLDASIVLRQKQNGLASLLDEVAPSLITARS
jgi:hypothetical protein